MVKFYTLRKGDLVTPPASVRDNHPLFANGSIGLLTAESPIYNKEDVTGNEGLARQLDRMGLKYHRTTGRYNGKPENSFTVYNPTRHQLQHLGKRFGQEAVIYSEGGKHEFIFTNGADEGKHHPSLPQTNVHKTPPEDNFTTLPDKSGHLSLVFDWSKKLDTPGTFKPSEESEESRGLTKATLKKTLDSLVQRPGGIHPNGYAWHDGHTSHHMSPFLHKQDMATVRANAAHPHTDGAIPHQNDQAAPVGVHTYAKFAEPYGTIKPGTKSNLLHYPYHNKLAQIQQMVKDRGYSTYYAGGKLGKPDLANRNYNTKHLMIYDPTPESGGDFGEKDYTDGWRQIHELSHALTYPQINTMYGEGRRIGKLGTHRSIREAQRAVHWEWLAAHKQRELSSRLGVTIPDDVFHKELNTVMHDAVHRAVTGQFTEPSGEGYYPHSHKVPLETALSTIAREGAGLGLRGSNDTLKKRP